MWFRSIVALSLLYTPYFAGRVHSNVAPDPAVCAGDNPCDFT